MADHRKDARAQAEDHAGEFLQKFPLANVARGDLGGWFHFMMQVGGEMVRKESKTDRDAVERLYAVQERLFRLAESIGSENITGMAIDLGRGIAEAEEALRKLRQGTKEAATE